ncbi:MAG: hypothetical protein JWN70_1901, partial [Planctomycetaceae bacterium]|nr:hypothetical protein [Planctomycetaceae bacterium]
MRLPPLNPSFISVNPWLKTLRNQAAADFQRAGIDAVARFQHSFLSGCSPYAKCIEMIHRLIAWAVESR